MPGTPRTPSATCLSPDPHHDNRHRHFGDDHRSSTSSWSTIPTITTGRTWRPICESNGGVDFDFITSRPTFGLEHVGRTLVRLKKKLVSKRNVVFISSRVGFSVRRFVIRTTDINYVVQLRGTESGNFF